MGSESDIAGVLDTPETLALIAPEAFKYRRKGWTVDGKMTYHEYIQSEAWKAKKAQFRASGLYLGRCKACGRNDIPIHLHHRTYKRLGQEWLHDLVELCESCHHKGHKDGLPNFKMARKLRVQTRRKAMKVLMASGKKRRHAKHLVKFCIKDLSAVIQAGPERLKSRPGGYRDRNASSGFGRSWTQSKSASGILRSDSGQHAPEQAVGLTSAEGSNPQSDQRASGLPT